MAVPMQRRATQYPALLAHRPRAIPTGVGSKPQFSERGATAALQFFRFWCAGVQTAQWKLSILKALHAPGV